MSHTAELGDVEVPATFSPDEAVGLMRQEGIVGAGGAGFPTYVKYQSPPRTLIVNGADSEPGYYKDKLLMRDEPEALIEVFQMLDQIFSIDTAIVVGEEIAKPYMQELEELAEELQNFSVGYIPAKYKYGEERALIRALTGMEIPKEDLPTDHGIVVNNVETLFNMYRAEFRERPVITKFLHLYGEVPGNAVYEAPIGTFAEDLIRLHGEDPSDYEHCKLYDGGPILSDLALERMGPHAWAPVRKTTNAFLVVHPDKDRPRKNYYPTEDGWEHNDIDADFAVDEIVNVEDRVDRVRVPIVGNFQAPGKIKVTEGDEVDKGQLLAAPHPTKLSVGCHASIAGEVTAVTSEWIEITT